MLHSFDEELAVKYGVNAAILLQNIYWWIRKNAANERNFHDGCYWTYNSRAAFVELFPYLSERQIKTAMDKLIDDGVIKTGDYNTDKWKRPTWYALTEKGWSYFKNVPIVGTEMSDRQNKTVSSNTDIYTDNNINNINNMRARACEEEVNPFGDSDYRPPIGTIQQYAVNSFSAFGYRAQQELNSFVDDLGEDVVRHAIDNALERGKTYWGYCKSILNGYVQAGVKTVGAAKAHDEEFKRSKANNSQPKSDYHFDTKKDTTLPPLGKDDIII